MNELTGKAHQPHTDNKNTNPRITYSSACQRLEPRGAQRAHRGGLAVVARVAGAVREHGGTREGVGVVGTAVAPLAVVAVLARDAGVARAAQPVAARAADAAGYGTTRPRHDILGAVHARVHLARADAPLPAQEPLKRLRHPQVAVHGPGRVRRTRQLHQRPSDPIGVHTHLAIDVDHTTDDHSVKAPHRKHPSPRRAAARRRRNAIQPGVGHLVVARGDSLQDRCRVRQAPQQRVRSLRRLHHDEECVHRGERLRGCRGVVPTRRHEPHPLRRQDPARGRRREGAPVGTLVNP
eukprot:762433-Hanusia_phi.AAC.27